MKTSKLKLRPLWLIITALLLCLPLFLKGYYVYVLNLMGIYFLVSLGLNLLTGYCGQISIGHAAFLAIGSFGSATMTQHFGLPFWFALPLSGLAGALFAFLVGIPVLRLRLIFLAIATICLGIITHDLFYTMESISGGANGIMVLKPAIGPFVFKSDKSFFYIVLVTAALITYLLWKIVRSKTGRAFLAIRESERAAAAIGINIQKYRMLAFVISGFYTGIAGSLYAHMVGYLNIATFEIFLSISFLFMIIIGGLASIPGSLLGAAFLVLVPEALRDVPGAKEIQVIIFGVLTIVFIIYLPGGLATAGQKIKNWISAHRMVKG
ncbi:MAG: branched-chain amino acid ABC transporter permease [Deltaproteobacteria bacterium]|nr:branched-chain amino acid ABC transporter permease [Deltaproteobacteria bacterium]